MSVYPRKTKSGRSWMIDFQYIDPCTKTVRRHRKIAKGVANKREACIRERELREALETPPPPPEQQAKDARFGDFAGHWLTIKETDLKPTARRGYEQILRVHLVPWFAGKRIREITVEDIQHYKRAKLRTEDKGLAPKTVNNHLGVLSSLMEDAVAWRYAPANPVKSVKKCLPDRTAEDFLFWTADESEHFLEAVKQIRPRWLPFYTTALRTGLRLGELAALRWENIDFERNRIRVKASISDNKKGLPKNDKFRTISMSPHLRVILAELKLASGGKGRVFVCDKGGVLNSNRVKTSFQRCAKAAGVPRIRIHDLRHSFASQLVNFNTSIYKVQKLLGHADVKTTMRYAHLSPEAEDDAVAVLDHPPTKTAARLRHAGPDQEV
jgi:integrase